MGAREVPLAPQAEILLWATLLRLEVVLEHKGPTGAMAEVAAAAVVHSPVLVVLVDLVPRSKVIPVVRPLQHRKRVVVVVLAVLGSATDRAVQAEASIFLDHW
jgi:hypothetical protein